ncbi:MAG: hypothetical protein WD894_13910 [Pirellulales bacterium]
MAYLLPCSQCGRKLLVTTGEAGGQLRCECGALVDVPTVRRIRELEPAAAPSSDATTSWTTRHSLIFLGSLVAIAGLAFGLILHFRAANALSSDNFADEIRNMPAADTWTLWSQVSQLGVGSWQPPKGKEQLDDIKVYEELKRWEFIGFGLAGVGVVLAIVGITMLGPKRPATPKRPPRRPATAAERK